MPHRLFAEAIGTFFILLCGAGSAAAGGLGPVGMALVWGGAVASMVAAMSSTSGAHFNPAVTLALTAGKKFRAFEALGYLVAQLVGACGASLVVARRFATSVVEASTGMMGAEVVLTGLLVFYCLAVGHGVESGRVHKRATPALVGLLIASLNFGFGHLGVGLNPAMAIAPRVVHALSGTGTAALIGCTACLVGPLIGGLMGGAAFAVAWGSGDGIYTNFAKLSRHVWGEGLRYDAPLERSYEEALELSFEAFVA